MKKILAITLAALVIAGCGSPLPKDVQTHAEAAINAAELYQSGSLTAREAADLIRQESDAIEQIGDDSPSVQIIQANVDVLQFKLSGIVAIEMRGEEPDAADDVQDAIDELRKNLK